MNPEPLDRPIGDLALEIRSGALSPVTLVESAFERISRHDDRLQSFVHVSDTALEAARRAEREIGAGIWQGPLHGIPIAIKDNYLTRDMPTRAGTECPDITFPQADSNAVARLRAAGAIPIGKTRMHEFAWGMITPPTRNPWNLNCVPGGSSGGSGAAVIAGLAPAALGSDTGGSIRIPASLCGTVGLKPTFGRIGRGGIVPHSWSLDHAGPLTRTVGDAAILLQALAGPDPGDPSCQDQPVADYSAAIGQPIEGLRLGVCRNHFFGRNQAEVETAVETAIGDLGAVGAEIREFELPNLEHGLGAIFAIELASSTAYHDASLRAGLTPQYQPDVRTLVEMGRLVSGPDYLKAEQFRRVLMQDFHQAFSELDAILTPTMPLTAWPTKTTTVEIGGAQESVLAVSWRLTYPFNLTGLPAISLPCGFDNGGLPIGLQIAARPFDEAMVLRIAHAYEQSHDWWLRQPQL